MKKNLLLLSCILAITIAKAQMSFQKKDSIAQQLSLVFIGDFMGHKDQIDAAYDSISQSYDYTDAFMYMQYDMSKPDVTIGNLEVPLGIKPYSGYPQFSSPASYAKAIQNTGVDILVTANNHSCDKGKKGLEKTINILDSLKIEHSGTYISQKEKEEQNPFIIKKNGFKIALINYTYGTNGLKPVAPNVVNYIKEDVILSDIAKAKKAQVDEIIAFVHWGKEYQNLPDAYQKKWEKFFKDNGVNIIIGAHPHVVQPMKHDKKNNTFIAYSLGNFVSHQRTFPRDGGALLKLNFIKKDNTTTLESASYKLTWVHEPFERGLKRYYVLPVSDFEYFPEFFEHKSDYQKMMRYAKHARTLLGKENINVIEYR